MPEISIIVPVYKVEKFLDRCVRSILSQTYQDFELILVDDGSPDNCPKICDKYAKEDTRVRVLHKENGGLSDARNAGVLIAKGKYIGFVDSDDYIAPDMYETLYNNLTENNADVSVCGTYDCYGDNFYPSNNSDEFFVVDTKEAVKMVLDGRKCSANAWNKLYKKELFDEIKYPVGKLFEDAFVTPRLFSITKRVVITTKPKYYYVHRKDSITTAEFNIRDFDLIHAYEQNLSFVKETYPDIIQQAEFRYIWAHMCVLDKMIMTKDFNNQKEYDELVKFLRKNTMKILKDPCFTTKRKLAAIALLLNQNLYKKVALANNEKNKELFD